MSKVPTPCDGGGGKRVKRGIENGVISANPLLGMVDYNAKLAIHKTHV